MTRGIIYYTRGTKCLIRLAVSLYSLRKVYRGDVAVMFEGESPPQWFFNAMLVNKYVEIPPAPAALVQKSRLWKWAPYDTNLFIDADTLVLEDPTPLFAEIEKTGFAVTRFADWISTGKKIGGRIKCWKDLVPEKVIDDALAYGPAINTGVFGFQKNHPMLPAWDKLTTAGHKHPRDIMARTLDETACQVLAAQFRVTVMDQRWNYSVNYGVGDSIAIGHAHGGKHVMPGNRLCDLWKDCYWEMRHKNLIPSETFGDKRLEDYLRRGSRKYHTKPVVQSDLTICTAADTNYAPRLTRNFLNWMKTPGLREQQFLIFCVDSDPSHEAYNTLRGFSNVRLVEWKHHAPTIRERAFSAFVFGVAEHVDTTWFMKLDADTEVTKHGRFEWPDYQAHTITSDPWHYTRVKGDREAKQHWLATLDEWFGGEPIFPLNIPTWERHGHKRIRSYCHIEKTEFTRRVAKHCGARLPIPSQDTTVWYLATRWGESINRHKFRKWVTA